MCLLWENKAFHHGSFFSTLFVLAELMVISLGLINIWHRQAAMSSASQQPRLMMGFFFSARTWLTSICLLHLFSALVCSRRLVPQGLPRSLPLLLLFTCSSRAPGPVSIQVACQAVVLPVPTALHLLFWRLAWQVIFACVVPIHLHPGQGVCAPVWSCPALWWHHSLLTQTARRVERFSIWRGEGGGVWFSPLTWAGPVDRWKKTNMKTFQFSVELLFVYWCVKETKLFKDMQFQTTISKVQLFLLFLLLWFFKNVLFEFFFMFYDKKTLNKLATFLFQI